MLEKVLVKLGLSEKESSVYLACLKLGPSPVRRVAEEASINRGTTYDILKSLVRLGLVGYFHKNKRQCFIAEDPDKLRELVTSKEQELLEARGRVEAAIPELKSLYNDSGEKPVIKYYEGDPGIKIILKDVINSCNNQSVSEYYVYSSDVITNFLYKLYPGYTRDRVRSGIKVKVISIGPGGQTRGLDERKWLSRKESAPTYIIIYVKKVAIITVDNDQKPLGVIVEDENIYNTQKIIFDFVWKKT